MTVVLFKRMKLIRANGSTAITIGTTAHTVFGPSAVAASNFSFIDDARERPIVFDPNTTPVVIQLVPFGPIIDLVEVVTALFRADEPVVVGSIELTPVLVSVPQTIELTEM